MTERNPLQKILDWLGLSFYFLWVISGTILMLITMFIPRLLYFLLFEKDEVKKACIPKAYLEWHNHETNQDVTIELAKYQIWETKEGSLFPEGRYYINGDPNPDRIGISRVDGKYWDGCEVGLIEAISLPLEMNFTETYLNPNNNKATSEEKLCSILSDKR